MKMKTTKEISREAQLGAFQIANSKLTNELTDRNRDFLAQEIYHLVMKTAIESMEQVILQTKGMPKQIIVNKGGKK